MVSAISGLAERVRLAFEMARRRLCALRSLTASVSRQHRDALQLARHAKVPLFAQHRQAERVEGVDRRLVGTRQQAREPLAHLGGGAAREGDGETGGGRDAVRGDEMGDPMRQRAGLARARTGDDQQRSGRHRGGAALVVVEVGEDVCSIPPLKGEGGRRSRPGGVYAARLAPTRRATRATLAPLRGGGISPQCPSGMKPPARRTTGRRWYAASSSPASNKRITPYSPS